jgi:hypothetical protein
MRYKMGMDKVLLIGCVIAGVFLLPRIMDNVVDRVSYDGTKYSWEMVFDWGGLEWSEWGLITMWTALCLTPWVLFLVIRWIIAAFKTGDR